MNKNAAVTVCLFFLVSVASAYDPGLFNSTDNITGGDIAPKMADSLGHGLVGVTDNASQYIDMFIILCFVVILLYVIDFFKAGFKTWGHK
jgi:hypothetical protein